MIKINQKKTLGEKVKKNTDRTGFFSDFSGTPSDSFRSFVRVPSDSIRANPQPRHAVCDRVSVNFNGWGVFYEGRVTAVNAESYEYSAKEIFASLQIRIGLLSEGPIV